MGHRSRLRPETELLDRGWVTLAGVVDEDTAHALAERCLGLARTVADHPEFLEMGDKPVGGTIKLGSVQRRVPEVNAVLTSPELTDLVKGILGEQARLDLCTFRCPQPGYGAQRLHADDLPKLDDGPPLGLTAIVALTRFTSRNGPTRILPGSHCRPDLQQRVQSLDEDPAAVTVTGPAGTAFVFSRHVLHSGTLNRSRHPRPALQIGWSRTEPNHPDKP